MKVYEYKALKKKSQRLGLEVNETILYTKMEHINEGFLDFFKSRKKQQTDIKKEIEQLNIDPNNITSDNVTKIVEIAVKAAQNTLSTSKFYQVDSKLAMKFLRKTISVSLSSIVSNIIPNMSKSLIPIIDQSIKTLISDLKAKGVINSNNKLVIAKNKEDNKIISPFGSLENTQEYITFIKNRFPDTFKKFDDTLNNNRSKIEAVIPKIINTINKNIVSKIDAKNISDERKQQMKSVLNISLLQISVIFDFMIGSMITSESNLKQTIDQSVYSEEVCLLIKAMLGDEGIIINKTDNNEQQELDTNNKQPINDQQTQEEQNQDNSVNQIDNVISSL